MGQFNVLTARKLIMDLSEVYLRQLDEKFSKQLTNQQLQIELLREQIEILKEIDLTNKDMETYIKGLNEKQ